MMSVVLRTPAREGGLHTPPMFSRDTQALMEAAVDAVVVIDHRGKLQAVNEAARRTFGYVGNELLGENVSRLMPEPDRGNHDHYLTRFLDTGVAKIIGFGRQVTAQRKDGTLFPARLSVGRIPDSKPPRFVGFIRDTTREQESTAALKMERDRANAYLALHDSILMTLDSGRRVTEVNARGCELLGAGAQTILGRDWLDFLRGDTARERGRLLLTSALAGSGASDRELDAVPLDGQTRRIHWRSIARRSANGFPAGWLCSGVDITDRVRREEKALLAKDRLTRVAQLATMGEMAAGLAHELNQPLTAITTYARACEHYLAMPQPDLVELREAVREIGDEGMRAGKAINRLRQLVRSDERDERAPTDINTLVEELNALLVADARVYDTRLVVALARHLPRVDASAVQIQQVVLNLVRNAFEALAETLPGEREVRLTTLRTVTGDVEILVADNGPGVQPAMQDRLFDPFSTTKKSGSGLGLAISHTIVQSHGGTIISRQLAPHGASFCVNLPGLEDERS